MRLLLTILLIINSSTCLYSSILQSFYSIKDGMLSNTVDYITKDSSGIIYLSTSDGLTAFTGAEFFIPEFSDKIRTVSFVKCLTQLDKEHLLICSGEYGLLLYDKRKQVIAKCDGGSFLKEICSAYKDANGVLWFASCKGKIWYLEDCNDIINNVANPNFIEVDYTFPEINRIGSMFGKIYVCSSGNEFFFLDNSHNEVKIEHIPLADDIKTVYCAVPVDDERIIIGTDNGAFFLESAMNGSYFVESSILNGCIIRCVENTCDGVFLGTEGKGLYVYKGGMTESFKFNNKHTDNLDYIISSYYDEKGNLWLGSWNGGLVCLTMDKGEFRIVYNSKESDAPLYNWCLESFPDDSVTYIGTHGIGLAYLTPSMGEYKVMDTSFPLIKSLYADSISGALYVGTFGKGLRVFDVDKKSYRDTYIKEIENERVYVIYPYSEDKLLIGTSGKGVWFYDKLNHTSVHVNIPFAYEDLNVRGIEPNIGTGGMWIGTYNNGLYHLKLNSDGSYSNFFHVGSVEDDALHVTGICNYDECTFVTTENGLYKISYIGTDYKIERIHSMRGLRLNKLVRLDSGHYVVSSYSGVYFLNEKFDILSVLHKEETVSDVRCNLYTGHLEIAGTNNIVLFNEDNLESKYGDIDIYFRSASVNGKTLMANDSTNNCLKESIEYADKLSLSPTDNNLDINLSCILDNNYLSIYVFYMLEGLETAWNRIPCSNAVIRYNSIPSGEYKLRIRVQSIDNTESERVLVIEKSDFWYKTGWAYLAYTVLFILFVLHVICKIKRKEKAKFFSKVQEIEEKKRMEFYDQKLKFITNISHDLKTPLTLVLSPLNDLINMPEMPDKFKPRLRSMILNGDNLLRKINKIINYKDMELYDDCSVEMEEYNLSQLVYEIVVPFKSYSESQGIGFEYRLTIPENAKVMINTDKNKLESVLENLISNAIKYTPKEGVVHVTIVSSDAMVSITIADTGKGISENDLPHIFDRYYCAKDSNGGTGIGLYLVKRYIDMLGGNISIDSTVGKGTTFHIELPVSCKESLVNMEKEDMGKDETSMKLLFIDDNKELREFFEEVFSSSYMVFTASSANEGVDIARRELPDLIVSDYMMPETDGLELCKILKNDILTSHIPFVMLSSLNTEEFKAKCWKDGVDLLEEKPFKAEILKIKFASLIKNRIILKNKYQYPITRNEEAAVEHEMSGYDKKFMDDFNAAIEENMENSELSIDDIATCMRMTHDQLYRKLKALTGISANQYIRSFRLRKAAKMMCENNCSVTEVLYTVGFSNPSYFTKCFKKEFGVLPSEYIEQNR